MKKIIATGAAVLASAVDAAAVLIEAVGEDLRKPKQKKRAGHGARLAAARIKAHRAAQAERTKDAPEAQPTRQQRRHSARRLMKMPVTMRQDDWHRLKGLPSIKPSGKRRAVIHA